MHHAFKPLNKDGTSVTPDNSSIVCFCHVPWLIAAAVHSTADGGCAPLRMVVPMSQEPPVLIPLPCEFGSCAWNWPYGPGPQAPGPAHGQPRHSRRPFMHMGNGRRRPGNSALVE